MMRNGNKYANYAAKLLDQVIRILLPCWHKQVTRPITLDGRTYQVCLDCGKHLPYSTKWMSPLSKGDLRRIKAARAQTLQFMSTQIVATAEREIAQ